MSADNNFIHNIISNSIEVAVEKTNDHLSTLSIKLCANKLNSNDDSDGNTE